MRDKTQQVVNHIKRNQTSQPFPVAEKKKSRTVSRVSLVSLSAQLSITKTPKNSRHVLVLSFPPHTINAISEPHRSGLFNSAKQKVIPRQLKNQKCNWYETFIPTFA